MFNFLKSLLLEGAAMYGPASQYTQQHNNSPSTSSSVTVNGKPVPPFRHPPVYSSPPAVASSHAVQELSDFIERTPKLRSSIAYKSMPPSELLITYLWCSHYLRGAYWNLYQHPIGTKERDACLRFIRYLWREQDRVLEAVRLKGLRKYTVACPFRTPLVTDLQKHSAQQLEDMEEGDEPGE